MSRDESDDEERDDEEDDLLGDEDEMTMRELVPKEGVQGGVEGGGNKRYRVVLLGESGVGKSALVRQVSLDLYFFVQGGW